METIHYKQQVKSLPKLISQKYTRSLAIGVLIMRDLLTDKTYINMKDTEVQK